MGKLTEDERHAITREKTLHNDLILLKINDSFDELTFKVMETYKWVDRNVDFKFLLKADEDSFVRIDALMRELKLNFPIPTENLSKIVSGNLFPHVSRTTSLSRTFFGADITVMTRKHDIDLFGDNKLPFQKA
jgi:hypothetical protein